MNSSESTVSDLSNFRVPAVVKGGRVNERIQVMLREVEGSDILHVGCVGHELPESSSERVHFFHWQLCRLFPEANVLGVDIDRVGISRMAEMGFQVALGDAQNLSFDSCFDTIVAGELIEHLENPGAFLKGAARGLKPGGRLVLSTPNAFSVMLNLMYCKNSDHAFNREHALWFCPQTLRENLRRSDFRVEKLLFVDDLEPDRVSAIWYRAFAHGWRAVRPFVPKRFRNTIVAVCRLA